MTTKPLNTDLQVGVARSVVKEPWEGGEGEGARLVYADWLADHDPVTDEEPWYVGYDRGQLLRESPGHYEVRNYLLCWVLDEPFSDWVYGYIVGTNELVGRDGKSVRTAYETDVFLHIADLRAFVEDSLPKCGVCRGVVTSGHSVDRAEPIVRGAGGERQRIRGWLCAGCNKPNWEFRWRFRQAMDKGRTARQEGVLRDNGPVPLVDPRVLINSTPV